MGNQVGKFKGKLWGGTGTDYIVIKGEQNSYLTGNQWGNRALIMVTNPETFMHQNGKQCSQLEGCSGPQEALRLISNVNMRSTERIGWGSL